MGICKNVDHRLSDTSIYGFKMIFVIAGVTDSTIVFVINYSEAYSILYYTTLVIRFLLYA